MRAPRFGPLAVAWGLLRGSSMLSVLAFALILFPLLATLRPDASQA